MNSTPPTVFHITHWKAGSQWVAEILKQSAPERFVASKVSTSKPYLPYKKMLPPINWQEIQMNLNQLFSDPNNYQLRAMPILLGGVYGTIYTHRGYFEHLVPRQMVPKAYIVEFLHFPTRVLWNWWNFGVKQNPYRCFFVMRDLRDTFISLYFSEKASHSIMHEKMRESRAALIDRSEEEGLINLIQTRPVLALIQSTWYGVSGVPVFCYEDLIRDPFSEFERMVDFCGIQVSRERLANIVQNNRFESVSGRRPGEEDLSSHYRKGISGDWKNHFTDRVKSEFKRLYGQVLIDTGYEKNFDW